MSVWMVPEIQDQPKITTQLVKVRRSNILVASFSDATFTKEQNYVKTTLKLLFKGEHFWEIALKSFYYKHSLKRHKSSEFWMDTTQRKTQSHKSVEIVYNIWPYKLIAHAAGSRNIFVLCFTSLVFHFQFACSAPDTHTHTLHNSDGGNVSSRPQFYWMDAIQYFTVSVRTVARLVVLIT